MPERLLVRACHPDVGSLAFSVQVVKVVNTLLAGDNPDRSAEIQWIDLPNGDEPGEGAVGEVRFSTALAGQIAHTLLPDGATHEFCSVRVRLRGQELVAMSISYED